MTKDEIMFICLLIVSAANTINLVFTVIHWKRK